MPIGKTNNPDGRPLDAVTIARLEKISALKPLQCAEIASYADYNLTARIKRQIHQAQALDRESLKLPKKAKYEFFTHDYALYIARIK